jgi:hypothetical protein
VLVDLVLEPDRRGPLLVAMHAAADDAPLLHLEQRGEVDVTGQLHDHGDLVQPVVRDRDLLGHPRTDASPAHAQHVGVGLSMDRTASRHVGGRTGLVGVDRQRLGGVAVEAQLERREHARVHHEQPVGQLAVHVAVAPRQGERLALHERHGRRHRCRRDRGGPGPR